MKIPTFKEKVLPVYEMEHHLDGMTTEGKQFKLILESIKEYEIYLKAEEMASILDYEVKAIDYAFRLGINTLHTIEIEPNYLDIANAVVKVNPYSTFKDDNIALAKYFILEKVLEEIKIINEIKEAVREMNFNYNQFERELNGNIVKSIDQFRRSFNND